MADLLDAVVVGAGQAGLGMAYVLKEAGFDFLVYERGRIGETWRTQRWDSFTLNTPNWMNVLPADVYDGPAPDGFYSRDQLVESFERYVRKFDLPVRQERRVTSVAPIPGEAAFLVTVRSPDEREEHVLARNVIVASGCMQQPKRPAIASHIPDDVMQLHAADYRNPRELPSGAVVVVGSGQSGCQITEDLVAHGRKVYLCTSRVGRLPRRHRGRDILEWWADMGYLDVRVEDVEDKAILRAAQPQVSGVGRYGHTVSLQQLARDGVELLGRLRDVQDHSLDLAPDLIDNMRFADERAERFKREVDAFIERAGIVVPEDDDTSVPARDEKPAAPDRLDLNAHGVTSIIWCTGFTADFSWLRVPALDESGGPVHTGGASVVPRVYFIGFPWLRARKSGLVYGIHEDALHIAKAIN
ncbi:MAG TPA: NAD(P)-binding domain-containing protein [Longimicrobiales bacterium]|nr:NAD(P)-binding domain-containing protein [Longimicrobiales bacterium]